MHAFKCHLDMVGGWKSMEVDGTYLFMPHKLVHGKWIADGWKFNKKCASTHVTFMLHI